MDTTEQLKREIEAAAQALGLAPSTIGERAGQGGRFYARLCDGKRVWPETADAVRAKISELMNHTNSRGSDEAAIQGAAE